MHKYLYKIEIGFDEKLVLKTIANELEDVLKRNNIPLSTVRVSTEEKDEVIVDGGSSSRPFCKGPKDLGSASKPLSNNPFRGLGKYFNK